MTIEGHKSSLVDDKAEMARLLDGLVDRYAVVLARGRVVYFVWLFYGRWG